MFYSVGEMAKKLGVAPSTLRYYDKEGLLPFVDRSKGGIRVFKDADLEWLRIIECLKKTGMPLRDIKVFVEMAMAGDSTIGRRLDLIRERKRAVSEEIEKLKSTLETLEFKCWYYETAQAAGTAEVPRNMSDDELPERFIKVRRELKEH